MLDFILLTFDISKLTLSTIISQILVVSLYQSKDLNNERGLPFGVWGSGQRSSIPQTNAEGNYFIYCVFCLS